MKKQNGFSQIFVMVVMLILAIALPVTANLVKKVQDNRSSAASNCSTLGIAACASTSGCTWTGAGTLYSAGVCKASGTMTGNQACLGKGGECQTIKNANGSFSMPSIGTNNCTVHGVTGSIQANLCTNDYDSVYRCCVPGGSAAPVAPPAVCEGDIAVGGYKCGTDGNKYKCTTGGGTVPYVWTLDQTCLNGCTNNVCTPGCEGGIAVGGYKCGTDGNVYKCTTGGGTVPYVWTKYGNDCQYGCSNGVCNNAPAPAPSGCGAVRNQCDGNNLNHCDGTNWSLVTACPAGCDSSNNTCKDECTLGQTPTCPTSTTRQFCNKDADGGIRLKTETCPNGCEGGNCKAAPAAPDCSDAGNHCYGEAYKTGCTGTKLATDNNCASKANYCAGTYYGTYNGCGDSRGCLGTKDCKDPAYTAPKLNLYFAISGVKKLDSCFGDLKFNVTVTKDGSNTVTSREVTATVVDNRFNTNLGDQIFKISDFALTNDYALTDKIKITIGSNRKILATIYGKDSQNAGFPALNKSQILVSDLANKTLSLFDYPILNGDIGTQGSLGTQDKVVNGADFAFMKNEWGKTCKSGENLNADLNGDCRVDTFDLQILKNAMAEQYSQKTD